MGAEPAAELDESASDGARNAHLEIYALAGRAFELIERHQTPPLPMTYALWYAYVSGSCEELAARLDEALSKGGLLSPYDINEICSAYLPSEGVDAASQTIGRGFEAELGAVLAMVQDGVKTSNQFTATLYELEEGLPRAASPDDLKSVVASLVEENRRMASSAAELSAGLTQSQRQIERLNRELEELQSLSLRDPLTKVANRRAFDARIAVEVSEAETNASSLCFALADLDGFKKINDTHGHQAGDAVLEAFASLINRNIKGQDVVARYGGEEFAIILPRTDVITASNLMVKIKRQLERVDFGTDDSGRRIGVVTASFGVSYFRQGMTVRDLIERADAKLYQAKNAGRNLVKADGLE